MLVVQLRLTCKVQDKTMGISGTQGEIYCGPLSLITEGENYKVGWKFFVCMVRNS